MLDGVGRRESLTLGCCLVNLSNTLKRQIEDIERRRMSRLLIKRIARFINEQNLSAGERLPCEHALGKQVKASQADAIDSLVNPGVRGRFGQPF